jgi:alpha-glucosidase
LPWEGDRPPYGFSREGSDAPWLDPPSDWASLTVAAESADETSMLSLYRTGLRVRRADPWSGDGGLRWLEGPESVVIFARGERFVCLVNFGPEPVELPAGSSVLISSNELEGGSLPQDTTVWLRQTRAI